MKFGLSLHPYSLFPDLGAMLKTVQVADQLGFETVAFGEHVIWPKSHQGVVNPMWYDSLVLGTAIAALTRRIKVYFSVLVVPYHHPVRLAKAIATLDVVSGGRLIIGAGVGWLETEFPPLSVPFKERGARTDEYLRAMKELWTSDDPRFSGRFVSFQDLQFEPRPVQKPHPPIWIGGYARRALVRAAELGDGMHPGARPWDQLRNDMAELRQLVEARGRRWQDFSLSYTLAYGAEQEELARQYRVRGIKPLVLSDRREETLEQLGAFERMGFRHIVLRFPATDPRDLEERMARFQVDIAGSLK